MTDIGLVPLLFATGSVFAVPLLLGSLVGWLNPRTTMGEWLRVWSLVCLAGLAVGYFAAVFGIGAVAWALWFGLVAVALVADVQALRIRGRERRAALRHPSPGAR